MPSSSTASESFSSEVVVGAGRWARVMGEHFLIPGVGIMEYLEHLKADTSFSGVGISGYTMPHSLLVGKQLASSAVGVSSSPGGAVLRRIVLNRRTFRRFKF